MLQHYLTIAKRLIIRQKGYFLLNTAGLVLGLTAVLLAFIFITDESRFDQFHTNYDHIVRVFNQVKDPSGETYKMAESPGLMAAALEKDFPEVKMAARYAPWFDEEVLLSNKDRSVEVKNFAFADAKFFEILDFKLLRGNPKEALVVPGQVLITPKVAQALFGNEDPIGKTFLGLQDQTYTVSGIIAEPPRQSHIQFEVLASWASTEPQLGFLPFDFMNNWLGQTVYTYALLEENADLKALNKKMPDFVQRYMSNRTENYSFYFQPLSEIYLNSYDMRFLRGMKIGSATFTKMFFFISTLILIIACFNYVNISTAKSLLRSKEVGVKKVLGANRKQLLSQFLSETFVFVILAAILALIATYLLLPFFNQTFARELPKALLFAPMTIGFLSSVVLITSLGSGFYPGLILSHFKPISALRSQTGGRGATDLPRQILTVGQLTLSVALIAGTFILNKQFDYLLNKDLGFDKDQVLVMSTPPGVSANVQSFRNELESFPGVKSVSICQAAIGAGTFGTTVLPEGSNNQEVPVQAFRVESSFIETYGMKLAAGRFFNPQLATDSNAVVINETLAKQMGWNNALDKTIQFELNGEKAPIIGVLKDFHYFSFHEAIAPVVMYLNRRVGNISVRIDPQNIPATLAQLERTWKQFETRYPFDYTFVDESFAKQYEVEQRTSSIFTIFSIIAIFIACLGLYGLTAFSVSLRTKEIGVRKVLGASVGSILMLFHTRLLWLTLIAFALGTPLAVYFTQRWLEQYAYAIQVHWWMYAIAGLVTLAIASAAVLSQSFRAASANPVKSLRTE